MRKLLLLLLGVLLLSSQLFAQSKTVTGKITDHNGNPVPNASVIVKATQIGTTSGADGSFTLEVPANSRTLVISSLGMVTQEISIGNKTSFTISMKAGETNLQEVVVVAYGTQKKASLTGVVATVKAQDIENKPFTSIDKALQGQVAGLQSVSASGQPGAAQAILIRGVSSINAATGPLWVIDGVPVNTGDVSRLQTTSNLLSTLNPNDVESISVLKDAASQSIYGSRAANGVIVVTTKRGKAGKTKLRFDTELGYSDVAYKNDRYTPLKAGDFFTLAEEGMKNQNRTPTFITNTLTAWGKGNGVDFDWLDAVSRKGSQQQYNLSMEGGNEKTTFYLSGGHFVQEGTTINSKMQRTSGNFRIQHKPIEKLTVGFNLNGGYVKQRAPLNGGAFGNPVLSGYFIAPSQTPYNPDGTYKLQSLLGGVHNTLALTELDKRFLRETSLRGSLTGEYKILDNLKFRTAYGADFNMLEEDQYNNPLHGDGQASGGRAYAYYTRYYNWVWTNTLDWTQNLTRNGDLVLNAQAGYESQKSSAYLSSLQSQVFPVNLGITMPAVGASPITASANISEYTFISQFASANFNLHDKYILAGSYRRDGSSRFSPDNKYGNFWSVSASWNIDKEAFMENVEFIDQLKLRTSYGVNGNAGIGNYDWQPLYGYGSTYNQQPGSSPSNVGDSGLTWELNKPFNIGLDVSVLKNRLSISADWYVRKSENLLLDVPLSRTSGFSSTTRNLGAMENKGIELTVNAIPVQTKDFTWTIDFNFAHNANKITQLPGGNDIADGNFVIRQGESYRSFFLRQYAGVDPATGSPQWYTDASKATKVNSYPGGNARVVLGSALPKYFGSFTNSINFKGFSLEAQLYYNFGNYLYDTWGSFLVTGSNPNLGKVKRALDRWQKPNDQTDIPKYLYADGTNFAAAHSFWMKKGDFIRLRNIQLGYTIPKTVISRLKMSNAFFYIRGTNLWTWTKDDDMPFDPEQGTNSSTNLNVFIPKTMTVGLNITF
ncbi:TonB-dependent receptor [Pseudoflavitalea sp. G-6-1-2]|uniref:SusC/RagA family TonB-linked outer membrane protein n=1 Tax=Pseudoflavitalea sp. G-6-1-2 TaxID=2728841 RepID=UPI00146C7BF8|nr:TonB-dependent receptor [Pseudoflavitalea sp. G-6-1-2]NML19245.1 TonB-dependent receptor [Pseudoflavitalea sp. G-6-1-2]